MRRGCQEQGEYKAPCHELGEYRAPCHEMDGPPLPAGVGEEVCAVGAGQLLRAVRLPEGARRRGDAPHRRPRRRRPPVTAHLRCPRGPARCPPRFRATRTLKARCHAPWGIARALMATPRPCSRQCNQWGWPLAGRARAGRPDKRQPEISATVGAVGAAGLARVRAQAAFRQLIAFSVSTM